MSNILIISATSNNNLHLAENIKSLADNENINTELINLENYSLPLYTPEIYQNGVPENVHSLIDQFQKTDAFIVCAPEYNGSIPPIITNVIAWITVSTNQWREVFSGKVGLIATHSAGSGQNFLRSMRIQLEHLGVIVLPRTIAVTNHTGFNSDSSRSKIKQLKKLIKP